MLLLQANNNNNNNYGSSLKKILQYDWHQLWFVLHPHKREPHLGGLKRFLSLFILLVLLVHICTHTSLEHVHIQLKIFFSQYKHNAIITERQPKIVLVNILLL